MSNASNAMDIVKQTSKTILFEEFNPLSECESTGKLRNLKLMLDGNELEDMEDFSQQVDNLLGVSSFEEFVKNFSPDIYETLLRDENNRPCGFKYSIGKFDDNGARVKSVKLDTNEFYNMIMNLYEKRKTSGQANLDFPYSEITKLLSPSNKAKDFEDLRLRLNANTKELAKLDASKGFEIKQKQDSIKSVIKEIEGSCTGSIVGILQLAIADNDKLLSGVPILPSDDSNGDAQPLLTPAQFKLDKNGFILAEKIETSEPVLALEEKSSANTSLSIVQEKTEKITTGINKSLSVMLNKNGFEKDGYEEGLVLSVFAGVNTRGKVPREILIEQKKQYSDFYKMMQEQFANAVTTIVEKMLNVKVFFDNATINGELHSKLIVANCKADRLINGMTYDKFKKYLNSVKDFKEEKTIWYSIIPAIYVRDNDTDVFADKIVNMSGDFDSVEDFDSFYDEDTIVIEDENENDLTSLTTTKTLINDLAGAGITTFFNFKANETTSFNRLSTEIIAKYTKQLSELKGKEEAIFCYPNFTILPSKETQVEVGDFYEDGTQKLVKQYMYIKGVYVDSSYVAAGLIAGTQSPNYLTKKGFKVNKNYPCVRFNIEDNDNSFKLLTSMCKESSNGFTKEVKESINEGIPAFVFSSDTKYYNGNEVKHAFVLTARRMNGKRLFIYSLRKFLEQMCESNILNTDRCTSNDIKEFIKSFTKVWQNDNDRDETKDNVNNIFYKDEAFSFVPSEGIKVKINGEEDSFGLTIEVTE